MSISDKRKLRHTAWRYFGIAILCGLFSAIYEHFSHGVYSNYMIYLFLFPLIGGLIPLLVSAISRMRCPTVRTRNFWGAGIATFTFGSCLKGIFDIYGTTVSLVNVYWIVGILMVSAALISYCQKTKIDKA